MEYQLSAFTELCIILLGCRKTKLVSCFVAKSGAGCDFISTHCCAILFPKDQSGHECHLSCDRALFVFLSCSKGYSLLFPNGHTFDRSF